MKRPIRSWIAKAFGRRLDTVAENSNFETNLWHQLSTMTKLCIVIPMYNEAKRFDQLALLRFVEQNPNYSICLVNDGSKDSTWELIEEIRKKNTQVFALNLQLNSGKSEATRLGIIESLNHDSFDFVAFLDADFAAPLETIPFMFEQTSNKQFLLGSRILFYCSFHTHL